MIRIKIPENIKSMNEFMKDNNNNNNNNDGSLCAVQLFQTADK